MVAEVIEGEAVELGQELELRPPAPVNLFHTSDPAEVIERATATAKPLADVIRKQKLFKDISGRKHVLVEGWTLLGSMLGVFAACVWTRKLENGWEARVEARTLNGQLVGAAEAMCLRSETLWKSRDEYAIRSMAQTRATSKALRQPLGFVVQLAGFQPEPAEEVASPEPAEPKSAGGSQSSAVDSPPAESPFKIPAAAQKKVKVKADALATELVALVAELGATDSLPSIERHREALDVDWLTRQIATAKKAKAGRV